MDIKIGQSSEKGLAVQYQVKILLNHIIKNMTTIENQQIFLKDKASNTNIMI